MSSLEFSTGQGLDYVAVTGGSDILHVTVTHVLDMKSNIAKLKIKAYNATNMKIEG